MYTEKISMVLPPVTWGYKTATDASGNPNQTSIGGPCSEKISGAPFRLKHTNNKPLAIPWPTTIENADTSSMYWESRNTYLADKQTRLPW